MFDALVQGVGLRASGEGGTLGVMRAPWVFVAGVLAGAMLMVLWLTLDPDWNGSSGAVGGGGNIAVVFDERALAAMVAAELAALGGVGGSPAVDVDVLREGLLVVSVLSGASGTGPRASVMLDPDVVEGRLRLRVGEGSLGALGAPEVFAELLEGEIGRRLDEAAGGLPYRLVAIWTVERRLRLDLKIE